MWIARVSVRNPVMVTMCVITILFLGLFSIRTLNIEQFPQVNIPFVVITTEYPGASPSTVELSLTKPLEEYLNQIEGLKTLSSKSTYGRSVITLQFFLGEDINRIMEDVRQKLSLARSQLRIVGLPDSRLTRFDPSSAPVAQLVLSSSTLSFAELTKLAKFRVTRQLVAVPGIAQLNIIGGEMPQVQIRLNPSRLAELGIGVDQVITSVAQKNRSYPLGAIESENQKLALEVHSPYRTIADLQKMVIAQHGDQLISLGEVADVRFSSARQQSLSLFNERRVVSMSVLLQSGSNLVAVIDHLRQEIPKVQSTLPSGVHLSIIRDESTSIVSALDNFLSIIQEGVLLTVLVVFLFLGSWRSMIITAISLPVSLLAAFIILYLCGYTINFLTLMALSLCVGLLIDDSIVVRENVVRHFRMGKSAVQAALEGTSEIGFAVLATTLTTVVVFLPICFMSGIVGLYFRPFAVTVVCVVLVSMIVSFTVDPMLSSVWTDPLPVVGQPLSWMQSFGERVHRFESWCVSYYARLLCFSLRWRRMVAIVALLIFVGTLLLIKCLGTEFVPVSDYGEAVGSVRLPAASSLSITARKMTEVSALLRARFPEIRDVLISINARQRNETNVSDLYILLKPKGKGRERSLQVLLPLLRSTLQQVAGIEVRYLGPSRQGRDGGGQNPLSFYITGSDFTTLDRVTQNTVAQLKSVPGLTNIQTSLEDTLPGIVMQVDEEQAARRNIQVSQVSSTLNALLSDAPFSDWEGPDGEVYDVVTQLPQRYTSERFLEDLFLTPSGPTALSSGQTPDLVPLSDFISWQHQVLPRDIQHYNLLRSVQISGNYAPGYALGDVAKRMHAAINTQNMPDGYTAHLEGEASDMQEAFQSFVVAMSFACFLIYAVLASQFKSFWDPLVIMMVLPLSFSGAVLGLYFGRQHLNIFSFIGILIMFGLSTKNSILLVDVIKVARMEGMSRYEAILRAGQTRFRPIMMTSLAMLGGMIPQLLPIHMGFETRQPMAYAVIGGVIVSTLLSLVVIPVVYTFFDDIRSWCSTVFFRRGVRTP